MKISLITVCYNCESSISKTIESVLRQDYQDVEYLIIDGASTDKTVIIAESYRERFEKKGYSFIVSSEPDKGIYHAMNKGIRKSTGELIGIINAGDWYEKKTLSVVSRIYKKNKFDYFFADINLIKPNGKIIVKHSKKDFFPTSRHWNHPTSFVTRRLYKELGLFRCKGIHDDFEFYLRVRKAEKKIYIRKEVLANFVTGGVSNKKSIKNSIRRIKDRFMAYRVNGYNPAYLIECIAIEILKAII